ncbi:MAG: hypothetical protein MJZ27_08155 [Bacteroidales bacterium]|nr:hypothetical protein [Bacteroidales bacterium]
MKLRNSLCVALGAICAMAQAQEAMPLVFNKENTAPKANIVMEDDLAKLPVIKTLPDPMKFVQGEGRATNLQQWEQRRGEILAQLQHYEIGIKPEVKKEQIKARMEVDTLVVDVTVGKETLTLRSTLKRPEGDGPFPLIIGIGFGGGAGSLPRQIIQERPIATLGYNFTQVTSHTQKRGEEPINKIYPDNIEIGSYSAWPWGVSRIIDALEILGPEVTKVDISKIAITGCSFAGKMALFSGAMDERIALTIAQEPGGGGAASWRVSETLGNVETLGKTNYSWFLESMKRFENDVDKLPIDHHELTALVAPRALIVLGNTDYEWLADESGYVSSMAAKEVWKTLGVADRMAISIEGGHGHCMLPESQWPEVKMFIDKFLLGKDVDTRGIEIANMFKGRDNAVDVQKWMEWSQK